MKIYKVSLYTLLCSIIFLSCQTRFEDDVRLLVKGNIVDESELPISDVEISVYTDRGSGLFGEGEFLLGKNFSQSNGDFNVVSLFDKQEEFTVRIIGEDNYTKYAYVTNTKDFTPENLTINLETVSLKQIAVVNFNINRTSGEGNTLTYSFNFENTDCIIYSTNGVIDTNLSDCFEEISVNGSLNDESSSAEGSLITTVNSNLEFVYSLNGAPEIIETYTINQDIYEIEFNY